MTPGTIVRFRLHNWRRGRGVETITGWTLADTPHPAYIQIRTPDDRLLGVPKDMVEVIQTHQNMVK